jgi:hypothetical protein
VTCEPLRVGEESQLIIKLCNPTQHQTVIQFFPLPSAEEDLEEREREIEEKKRKQAEKKDAEVSTKTSQAGNCPMAGHTYMPMDFSFIFLCTSRPLPPYTLLSAHLCLPRKHRKGKVM